MDADGDVHYDLAKQVEEFDELKIGAFTTIPRISVHPPENIADLKPSPLPVISLSGERSSVVAQVRRAAAEFGFFQITDHGIPIEVLNRTNAAIRAFDEQPQEVKAPYYRRDTAPGASVLFFSNSDLHHSKAASWRDTLAIRLGPNMAEIEQIPEICRKEMMEWNEETMKVTETLMDMVSEGLGLDTERLKELTCLEVRLMASHYYPYCPQAELTTGLTSHTDPGVLTVALQDQVSGLQVKYDGAWLDLKPEPGALIVSVGDMLEIMSNDEYKSVEHRAVGNPCPEPRASIAVVFNPGDRDSLFGPLSELISAEKPAVYNSFTFNEFITRFSNEELEGRSLINLFKLPD